MATSPSRYRRNGNRIAWDCGDCRRRNLLKEIRAVFGRWVWLSAALRWRARLLCVEGATKEQGEHYIWEKS
jgi:hypothetical protein